MYLNTDLVLLKKDNNNLIKNLSSFLTKFIPLINKHFRINIYKSEVPLTIYLMSPISFDQGWSFSDNNSIILIPKLFDDKEDIKINLIQQFINLIYSDFGSYFNHAKFHFQEEINKKSV